MSRKHPLIVHVMGYYPPHIGGAEIVTQKFAENLALRNSDVQVITSTVGQTKHVHEPTSPNLKVKRLKTFEFAHTPFMPGLILHLLRLPRETIFHVHLAQAFYPDLVMAIAKLRGQKYVLHFHL